MMVSEPTSLPGPERALAAIAARLDDRALERVLGHRFGLHAIFTGMTDAYRPEVANHLRGAVHYELTRSNGRRAEWTVWLGERRALAQRGHRGDPVLTLRFTLVDFLRIAAGQLDPVTLMRKHRLTVSGDGLAAARLGAMFGRPAPPDVYRAPMTPEMLVR